MAEYRVHALSIPASNIFDWRMMYTNQQLEAMREGLYKADWSQWRLRSQVEQLINSHVEANKRAVKARPLVFVRDAQGYANWWDGLSVDDAQAIGEAAEEVRLADGDTGPELGSLFLLLFQELDGAAWLRVEGLRPGLEPPAYLTLDIDPAYDGEGWCDGVKAVVNIQVASPDASTSWFSSERAYIEKPWRVFPVAAETPVREAVAEIIDTALAYVNQEIADRDRFTFAAREML